MLIKSLVMSAEGVIFLYTGRNRQLQGLAVAMAKLWERSSIAKVALKRGVQLTTSERMAEEIKVASF